jgi:predicted GNAT family acetyltransferase
MSEAIRHEEHGNRGMFFIESDGARIAEMTYMKKGASRIVIDHTEVQPSLRGQGIARRLVDAAVAWARQNNVKIAATCPYVIARFAGDRSLDDVSGWRNQ